MPELEAFPSETVGAKVRCHQSEACLVRLSLSQGGLAGELPAEAWWEFCSPAEMVGWLLIDGARLRSRAALSMPVSIDEAFGGIRGVVSLSKELLLSWGGGRL